MKKPPAKKKTTSRKSASPSPRRIAQDRQRALAIHERLSEAIPSPVCELDFRSPFELLVATILSAQSTDKMVNKVTPPLFERYPTPRALADAPQEAVEVLVHRTGFFRNKAKAIRESSRILCERFGGEVPSTMDELVTLPGVARKTANVVLGNAFGVSAGIAIDTHAGRVARRLGLTEEENPDKVEKTLCAFYPQEDWTNVGHRFVLHGRYVCLAKAPKCASCPVNELCPSALVPPEDDVGVRAASEWRIVSTRGEG